MGATAGRKEGGGLPGEHPRSEMQQRGRERRAGKGRRRTGHLSFPGGERNIQGEVYSLDSPSPPLSAPTAAAMEPRRGKLPGPLQWSALSPPFFSFAKGIREDFRRGGGRV